MTKYNEKKTWTFGGTEIVKWIFFCICSLRRTKIIMWNVLEFFYKIWKPIKLHRILSSIITFLITDKMKLSICTECPKCFFKYWAASPEGGSPQRVITATQMCFAASGVSNYFQICLVNINWESRQSSF